MKNTFRIFLIIVGFISIIFSTCKLNKNNCENDWDGDITVTGGVKLPYWVSWISYHNFSSIDGIKEISRIWGTINDVPVSDPQSVIRVKTFNSFVDLLTVQWNCDRQSCICDDITIDENEVENLLKIYNAEFFETKNIIVTNITAGVLSMNFRINSINGDGVIDITEALKCTTADAVIDLGISVTFAIEVDNSFISPQNMTVSRKSILGCK